MKSLLYREWLVSRKVFLMSVSGIFAVTLLAYLTRLSMLYGNLASVQDADSLNELTYFLFAIFIPFFVFALVSDYTTHNSDIQSGFQRLRYCLPVSDLKFLGAKYILKLLKFAGAWVFTLIWGVLLNSTCSDPELTPYYGTIVCIVCFLSVLTDALRTPALLCTRTHRQERLVNELGGVIPIAAVYGIGGILAVAVDEVRWLLEHGDFSGLSDMLEARLMTWLESLAPIMLGASLVLLLLGFGLSYLAVKRRET